MFSENWPQHTKNSQQEFKEKAAKAISLDTGKLAMLLMKQESWRKD